MTRMFNSIHIKFDHTDEVEIVLLSLMEDFVTGPDGTPPIFLNIYF